MAPSTEPTTAAPAARTSSRRAAKNLTLADYVEQHSAKAARAIRALGLTPTMERVEGYPVEQKGTVIGQDPQPGARLAKGDTVLLQIAAPTPQPSKTPNGRPRRRKQRHTEQTLSLFDAPPAPQPPAAPLRDPAPEAQPQDLERSAQSAADTRAWPAPSAPADADGCPDAAPAPQETNGGGRSLDDEFVVSAEEVLAGRRGPEHWRHPRTNGRILRRARRHPWLAGSLALGLAVWAIVGASAALNGQSIQPPAIHQPRAMAQHKPHRAMKLTAHPHPAGNSRALRVAAHRAPRTPLVVASRQAAPQPPATQTPEPPGEPADAERHGAGEPEQRGGGPFGP
jgi:hypothetical protein